MYTLCEQNVQVLNVTTGGTYSCRIASKRQFKENVQKINFYL